MSNYRSKKKIQFGRIGSKDFSLILGLWFKNFKSSYLKQWSIIFLDEVIWTFLPLPKFLKIILNLRQRKKPTIKRNLLSKRNWIVYYLEYKLYQWKFSFIPFCFRWTTSHHKIETLGPLRRPGWKVRMGPWGCPIFRRLVVAYAGLRYGRTCYCRRVPSSLLPFRRMTTIRDPPRGPQLRGSPGGPRYNS